MAPPCQDRVKTETRWTFFRVKLVFEFEFEISWSSGPLDLWTQKPWDSWTLGPLPSSTTSTYLFLLHYPNSFYLFLPPPSLLTPFSSFYPFTSFYLFLSPITSWFGMVWFGMGGGVRWLWSFLSFDIGEWDWRWTLTVILILKSCGVGGWNPGTSSFFLHSIPLSSSHLLLIPPSYSTLLPNLLLTPPTSSWRVSDD